MYELNLIRNQTMNSFNDGIITLFKERLREILSDSEISQLSFDVTDGQVKISGDTKILNKADKFISESDE